MPLVSRRAASTLAVVVIAAGLLVGCVPEPTETNVPDPNPSGEPTGEPAPSLTATPTGTPIDRACEELVSADTLYTYNPNFTAINYTPREGSAADGALEYQGVACRWQNQTGGWNIDVSVAQLDENTLTALKNSAFEESEMVPTYGDEAYFSVGDNGVGTAIVFVGPYWIVAESPVFLEPGDAIEIVESVITGLGA